MCVPPATCRDVLSVLTLRHVEQGGIARARVTALSSSSPSAADRKDSTWVGGGVAVEGDLIN